MWTMRWWLAFAALLFCVLPARAHALGGIKVNVVFTAGGGYEIDALFDLDTLPPALAARPKDAPLLLAGCHVFFDSREVTLHPVPGHRARGRRHL